ncbi:MAG: endolytic transglycosylase MltG [Candidatus Infernicultor aquiphilus]|uniref:Endolytic murein transglycosylase n=1 Tax=Candidatus Infernicultor aquiphilus TaxID=1805029 RepID=A0A2M8CEY4_9BACT|nr:MAG: endolytic transglycosylase MltG [Candidatus Atribacteria bacterium CG_4_9_14_3_um_filter_33_16]
MNFLYKLFFVFSLIFLVTILFLTAISFPLVENSTIQKIIDIPSGTNAKEIVHILEKNEIIGKNNYLFIILIKLSKLEVKLKFGEYNLSPSLNMLQILNKLARGEIVVYKITIPEGYNSIQIAELLDKKEIVEKESFLKLVKYGEKSWEGYLFPDTYEVPKKYGAENMLKLMLSNFEQVAVDNKLINKAEQTGFTMDEIITLASIIEKEAKFAEEKKQISSVFHNRLKSGMKLQSCATIQYILGKPKEKLEESDLEIESPYNTYLYKGLPPGPICNPGIDSIIAALEPANEDYLFFVLGDNGRHIFSKTYEEHLKNKNGKNDKKGAWH